MSLGIHCHCFSQGIWLLLLLAVGSYAYLPLIQNSASTIVHDSEKDLDYLMTYFMNWICFMI